MNENIHTCIKMADVEIVEEQNDEVERPDEETQQQTETPSLKLPFTILKFKPVYRVKPKLEEEYCPICQDILTLPPFEAKIIREECTISIGNCGHYFHSYCVKRTKSNSCAMCRQRWVVKSEINMLNCLNIAFDK